MTMSIDGVPGSAMGFGIDSVRGRLAGNARPADAQDILRQARTNQDADGIRATAVEFEAMFLGEMFRHMWAGVEVDPVFGGGSGEKMFRGMLIDAMSREVAGSRGIGIADMVERELLSIQEARS